jgi:hypothetical protein
MTPKLSRSVRGSAQARVARGILRGAPWFFRPNLRLLTLMRPSGAIGCRDEFEVVAFLKG